jgi:hypothetical protein
MKPFPPELNKTGSGPQPLTTSKDIFKWPFLRHFHEAASNPKDVTAFETKSQPPIPGSPYTSLQSKVAR